MSCCIFSFRIGEPWRGTISSLSRYFVRMRLIEKCLPKMPVCVKPEVGSWVSQELRIVSTQHSGNLLGSMYVFFSIIILQLDIQNKLLLNFIAWLKHFTGHNHPVIIFCNNARVRSNCLIFVWKNKDGYFISIKWNCPCQELNPDRPGAALAPVAYGHILFSISIFTSTLWQLSWL